MNTDRNFVPLPYPTINPYQMLLDLDRVNMNNPNRISPKIIFRYLTITMAEGNLIHSLASRDICKTTPLDHNTLLNNKYKVIEFLGNGAYGNVFKVEDTQPYSDGMYPQGLYPPRPRTYALKVLKSTVPGGAMKSAWREVRSLYAIFSKDTKCRESYAVHMNRAFSHYNHMFMVYSLMGPSLASILALNAKSSSTFSLSEVRIIGRQLASGLAFIHDLSIVHHDIKPDNVAFVFPEMSPDPSNPSRAKMCRLEIRILDFGSSGYIFEQGVGFRPATTRQYRSPEMTIGGEWSGRVDVWSLGVTLWEAYTGKRLMYPCRHDWDLIFILEAMFGVLPPVFRGPLLRARKATFDPQGWLSRDQMRKLSPGWTMPSKFQFTCDTLVKTRPECVQLMDLFRKMLVMTPKDRLKASEMLAHPFFRITTPKKMGLSIGNNSIV